MCGKERPEDGPRRVGMTELRTELGAMSDVAAVLSLVAVAGRDLIDVGCGAGDNTAALHAAGARITGVEPEPAQAARNCALAPPAGLAFAAGRAEALPAPDASIDGVLFFRSLHHVPVVAMDAALNEAARVLKPDGFLIVIEPSVEGHYYQLVRLYHDETAERLAAQAALARAASRFRDVAKFGTVHLARYATFEALVTRALGQGFNAIARERVESEGVRAMFESGRTAAGDFQFEQPMLIDLYRGPLAG